jgi:thymidine kinase
MAKLYFRYGTMSSAKTLNLLAVAHNYESKDQRVLTISPLLDDRGGIGVIESRVGISRTADLIVDTDTAIPLKRLDGISCILVDESQFLSRGMIEQLRAITVEQDIPVICYGLRTDFTRTAFEGSSRLMELADAIEEIKTVCAFCNNKAVFNLRYQANNCVTEGTQIKLGSEESYKPACAGCYSTQTSK